MKSDKKRDISHWIDVLARLVPDMRAAWRARGVELAPAQIYGKDGLVADPRRGVTSNRVKAVWKGQLEEFYGGWRRVQLPSSTSV